MKNKLNYIVGIGVGFLFIENLIAAQNLEFKTEVKKVNNYLELQINESTSEGPLCDLVVTRSEYVSSLKTVLLSVEPTEFCAVDAVGHRSTLHRWLLPASLRQSATLNLIINNKVTGKITIIGDQAALSTPIEGGKQ